MRSFLYSVKGLIFIVSALLGLGWCGIMTTDGIMTGDLGFRLIPYPFLLLLSKWGRSMSNEIFVLSAFVVCAGYSGC